MNKQIKNKIKYIFNYPLADILKYKKEIFFYIIYVVFSVTLFLNIFKNNFEINSLMLQSIFSFLIIISQYFSFIWIEKYIDLDFKGKMIGREIQKTFLTISALAIPAVSIILKTVNEETSWIVFLVSLLPITSVFLFVVSYLNRNFNFFKYAVLSLMLFLSSVFLIIITLILNYFIPLL